MGDRESLAGVGLILNTGTATWPKALYESYRVGPKLVRTMLNNSYTARKVLC